MIDILRSAELRAYIRSFVDYSGRRAIVILALVLAGALLEGIGIVMLIPFIGLLMQPDIASSSEVFSGISLTITQAFEALGLRQSSEQIIATLLLFVLIAILRGLVLWQRDIQSTALTIGFVDASRARLFHALARAPWPTLSKLNHAQIQHVITNDIGRIAVGSQLLISGSVNILFLVVKLGLAFALSTQMTLFVLVFLGAALWLLKPLLRRARMIGEEMSRFGQVVYDVMISFLSGLKLAKSINAESRFVDDFVRNVDTLRFNQVKFRREQAGARLLFQTSAYIVASGVLAFGLFVTQTPLPVLVALLVILSRLAGPFLGLQQSFQSIANMLPAFASYHSLYRELRTAAIEPQTRAGPSKVEEFEIAEPRSFVRPQEVVLRGVSYSYDGSERQGQPLSRLNLSIAPHEFVGLVGASGSGKTTLADIVTGLILPDSGSVCLDGQALVPNEMTAWRDAVSYVPQDPFLFDTTVRENLLWAEPRATETELWQALKTVDAEEFVRNLPEGLDTRVGNRGQQVSGGERQRICLARALLRQPVLLVLDEATNALDLESERRFLELLSSLKHTMSILVISHRLSSLAIVDRIAVMSSGIIVESGDFFTLSSNPESDFYNLLRSNSGVM